MKNRIAIAAMMGSALLLTASPLLAAVPEKEQSMVEHAGNAVMQPAKDVNLRKQNIPQKLIQVQDHPYDLENLEGCEALETEIASLDTLLGPDINQVREDSRVEKRERSVSRVAGSLIGGLIPFRGVIREISGANASERRYLTALAAGNARRSFLKGVAVTKGCISPPRPLELSLVYDYRGF